MRSRRSRLFAERARPPRRDTLTGASNRQHPAPSALERREIDGLRKTNATNERAASKAFPTITT